MQKLAKSASIQEYAQAIELDFLTNLMKSWKKRNHKLLQIGIGHHIEPSFFWNLGFDVTACAQNQYELEQSKQKNGMMIDYLLGAPDYLPFEDKTFDYVVLTHAIASSSKLNLQSHSHIQNLKYALSKKNPLKKEQYTKINESTCLECIVQEAMRVCANSVLIVENSSFAFQILQPALSPLYLRQLCDKANAQKHSLHFALSTPSWTWTKSKAMKSCLSLPHKIPFGSLVALQIDISQELLTTLPSYTTYPAKEV